MLFLVIPIFLSQESSNIYATIKSVGSDNNATKHTVFNEDILNDAIIKNFKKKYTNTSIIFRRFLNTDFYTISVPNQSNGSFVCWSCRDSNQWLYGEKK